MRTSHRLTLVKLPSLMLCVTAAGCSMLPFRDEGSRSSPPPLAAAPSGRVSAAPLPPPAVAPEPAPAPAPAPAPPPTGLASLEPGQRSEDAPPGPAAPPAGSTEIARTDLIGSWTIASAGDSCQLSMVLTTWTGGYRASTRGCANEALKGISAWNLEGQQVQLFNASGATVARLYPSSRTRFSGQTNGGGPVSVSR